MRNIAIAFLAAVGISGGAVSVPAAPPAVPGNVIVTTRPLGSHQTLLTATSPVPAKLVSMSIRGTNGNTESTPVVQDEFSNRWKLAFNAAPQEIAQLTLVFEYEDAGRRIVAFTP